MSKRNKGYLLLEAVASIAVIAIGLTVIMRSFASSFRASKVSQEYFTASMFLKDKMWELEEKAKRLGVEDSDAVGLEAIPNTGYKLNVNIEKLEDPDTLAKVQASVLWGSGKRVEVATFLRCKK